MKRNYFFGLLAALLLVPFSSVKAQYDAGDSTVCYNIMMNNFAFDNTLNWNDPNPGNWVGVVWNSANPARIVGLDLDADGSGGGSQQGSSWPINANDVFGKMTPFGSTGADARLLGVVDFTGLTELVYLDLRDHDSISDIMVSGLNNLEVLHTTQYNSNNSIWDTLDVSNLPNLMQLHVSGFSNLTYVDASNCPRLKRFKARSGQIEMVNLNGSDSLIIFNAKRNDLQSLDLTGKTQLNKLGITQNNNLPGITGLASLTALWSFSAADCDFSGTYDVATFDTTTLYKFCIRNDNGGNNHVDSVENWMTMNDNSPEVVAVDDNWLTLSNATKIFNELNPSNNYYGSDQMRWGGDTIYVGGMKDWSDQASITISGTPVASSFQLYDATSTPVGGANTTGIFTFPTINDTGEYYVEMTNPGTTNSVLLTTNNFWVLECPTIDTSTSVSLNTITSNEAQAGATYRWLDCDNGMAVIAGQTAQNFTATVNGNYAVEITLGAPCNNVDTSACVNIATVGIDEMADFKSVAVYPNPIQDQVTIELLEDYNNVTVMIMNLEGKMVYNNTNVRNNKLTIRTTDWKQGVYMVKVFSDEFTNTYKLIK